MYERFQAGFYEDADQRLPGQHCGGSNFSQPVQRHLPGSMSYTGNANLVGDMTLVPNASTGQLNYLGNTDNADNPWDEYAVAKGNALLTIPGADPLSPTPPDTECDVDPTNALCLVSCTVHVWEAGSWQAYVAHAPGMTGDIKAGYGMFVRSYKSGTMFRQTASPAAPDQAADANASAKSDVQAQAGKPDKGGPKKPPSNNNGWFVRLSAHSSELGDRKNVFGQVSGARDAKDGHDLQELVPFGNRYLSVTFEGDDFSDASWGSTSDYRSVSRKAAGEWQVLVRASSDVADITLDWETDADVLNHAVIRNEQTGETHPMNQGAGITFANSASELRFTIIVDQ